MAGFGFSADCVTRSRRNLPGIFLQFFLAAPQLPSTYVSSWLLFRFHTRYETSGRVISTSQRPILDNTQRLSVADIHDAKGFEPPIAVSERPHTHAFDGVAPENGTEEFTPHLRLHESGEQT